MVFNLAGGKLGYRQESDHKKKNCSQDYSDSGYYFHIEKSSSRLL